MQNSIRVCFFFLDPDLLTYIQKLKDSDIKSAMQRVSQSFEGEGMITVSNSEHDYMNPNFAKLSEILHKREIVRK